MIKELAAAALLALSVGSTAEAQLVPTSPLCTAAAFNVFNPNAIDCIGAFSGNVTSGPLVNAAMSAQFGDNTGAGTWGLLETKDDNESGTFLKTIPGSTTGTIVFQNTIYGFFSLGFKAGNSFSIYLFNGGVGGVNQVGFSTAGSGTGGSGSINALSNLSLYNFTNGTTTGTCVGATCVTTIPEPSTYALMAAGLLAMGFISRRRRNVV